MPKDILDKKSTTHKGLIEICASMLSAILTEQKIGIDHTRNSRSATHAYQELHQKVAYVCGLMRQWSSDDMQTIVEKALIQTANHKLLKEIPAIANSERLDNRRLWKHGLGYMIVQEDRLHDAYGYVSRLLTKESPTIDKIKALFKKSNYIPLSDELHEYLRQQDNDIVTIITNHIMSGGHLLDGKITDDHPHSGYVAEQSNR